MDHKDEVKPKVVILEDIRLENTNHVFAKPISGVSVQQQIQNGKKINILHRRSLLRGSDESDISSTNQLLQILQQTPGSSQTKTTGQKIVVSGSFCNLTDNIPDQEILTEPGISASDDNVSNALATETPKEPRPPLEIRKPKLELGENAEDVEIFTKHSGPEWYKLTNNIRTDPILTNNLSKAFSDFPIFGIPKNDADLIDFQDQVCQEFVGLSDEDYEKQKIFCNPDLLLTDKGTKMATVRPTQGLLHTSLELRQEEPGYKNIPTNTKLQILKNLNTRLKLDINNVFARRLKYRGIRLFPLQNQERAAVSPQQPPELVPGHDTLFRVRLFRPFVYVQHGARRRHKTDEDTQQYRGRHSAVFSCDVLVLGRQRLSELRDLIVCRNDLDLRLDMSEHPNLPGAASSRESFPSNFMFINNVFYVDTREGCRDLTQCLRDFARERGLGDFPVRDMCAVSLQDINVRLANPEVYVHQGNCEHMFQFSSVRLLSYNDPLQASQYPRHAASSQNQTLYCNTCADFAARWIVTNTRRVPFDPAFFCETCFHSYMYIDGKKVEDFKAYLYKGNEINMIRPNADVETDDKEVVGEVRILL